MSALPVWPRVTIAPFGIRITIVGNQSGGRSVNLANCRDMPGQRWKICFRRKQTFSGASTNDGFVLLLLILGPLVQASSGHERMSEVGERATTAECRLLGPSRKTTMEEAKSGA